MERERGTVRPGTIARTSSVTAHLPPSGDLWGDPPSESADRRGYTTKVVGIRPMTSTLGCGVPPRHRDDAMVVPATMAVDRHACRSRRPERQRAAGSPSAGGALDAMPFSGRVPSSRDRSDCTALRSSINRSRIASTIAIRPIPATPSSRQCHQFGTTVSAASQRRIERPVHQPTSSRPAPASSRARPVPSRRGQ